MEVGFGRLCKTDTVGKRRSCTKPGMRAHLVCLESISQMREPECCVRGTGEASEGC